MTSPAYQFGLLLVVAGGFLAMDPTGWGTWVMAVGALIALFGILQSAVLDREDVLGR